MSEQCYSSSDIVSKLYVKGSIRMKKNTGAQLALYPSPVIGVGAMVDGGLSV